MKNERMKKFENWLNPAKGLYRYVISAEACYEIIIMYEDFKNHDEPVKANLYLVGEWTIVLDKTTYFSRELLLENATIEECVKAAVEDDEFIYLKGENNDYGKQESYQFQLTYWRRRCKIGC